MVSNCRKDASWITKHDFLHEAAIEGLAEYDAHPDGSKSYNQSTFASETWSRQTPDALTLAAKFYHAGVSMVNGTNADERRSALLPKGVGTAARQKLLCDRIARSFQQLSSALRNRLNFHYCPWRARLSPSYPLRDWCRMRQLA